MEEYAEAMRAGADFPPIVVFQNGEQYILADGFHRTMAAACEGIEEIEAVVYRGGKSDALKYALGANVAHGLRRTNADKQRSVELALAEWPNLSDRQIADICAVSNRFIGEMRKAISTVNGSQLNAPRVGADGRERHLPRRRDEVEEPPIVQPENEVSGEGSEPETQEPTGLSALFEQPLAELTPEQHQSLWTRADAGLKTELAYHLDLVRADAQYLLGKLNESFLEAAELKDCEIELRFAAKKVEALIRHLIFLSEN